jgi:hypothetical protein
MSLQQVLFTAFTLILEDEGKNIIQLQQYGRIHDWIREFWFDPHGSSLAMYCTRTGVWPFNRTENALGMWLFWFLFKPGECRDFVANAADPRSVEDYWLDNNDMSVESPLGLLKAMAFGAHAVRLTIYLATSSEN